MIDSNIYVTRPLLPSLEEYTNELRDIWDAKWLTNMGAKHQQLELELQKFLKSPQISLLANGHMALEIALQALDIKGEVITTPFTFVSTTNAICRSGAVPVFCDIREDNYTMDASLVEGLITDKTEAIMPVHVYGNICDVYEIERIAQKHGLKVVYDAAHAFGVKYNGVDVSNFGDASCYSFHATKVYNTIEGGALCANNDELHKKVRAIRDFGINGEDDAVLIGTNAKMNEFEAAMGLCNLRHVSEAVLHRKVIYELYCEKLAEIPGVRINRIQHGVDSNYAYYPIVIDEGLYGHSRDELLNYLQEKHVFSRKYFYPIITRMTCYRDRYLSTQTPIAERVSENVLTLPIYEGLELETVGQISDAISEYHKHQ